MSVTDHFPKMRLNPPVTPPTLEGRETVDEFLARGGKIQHIPSGWRGEPDMSKNMTRAETLEFYRRRSAMYKRRRDDHE